MTIKTKLTQKEYTSASFAVLAARYSSRLILAIFFIVPVINIISGLNRPGNILATIIPILILYPGFFAYFYYSVKRGFKNNARLSETIEYSFNKNNFTMSGESFKAELSWKNIYKVTLTNKWLLIWQNKQIANAIPKIDLLGSDLDVLKDILTTNGVKNNL